MDNQYILNLLCMGKGVDDIKEAASDDVRKLSLSGEKCWREEKI